jgi:hypothetical protein
MLTLPTPNVDVATASMAFASAGDRQAGRGRHPPMAFMTRVIGEESRVSVQSRSRRAVTCRTFGPFHVMSMSMSTTVDSWTPWPNQREQANSGWADS